MALHTPSSPHTHGAASVSRLMVEVLLALLPGLAVLLWLFGWGPLLNLAIAMAVALCCEAAMLWLRARPILPSLSDGSAAVTAALLALSLPPLAPWWLTAVGIAFALVFAKHLYGGLGYNPFNPAMIGYAVLLISFPREMTQWLPPGGDHLGLVHTASFVFTGALPSGPGIDSLSAATPLDSLKTQLGLMRTITEITADNPIFGALGGAGWQWVNAAYLLGGLALLARRVISWQIPVAMLGGLAMTALCFYAYDPDTYASPLFHLFSGAAMLGAFFIATDPVTASTTARGRLVYGAGIGIIAYVIRTWGGYPDGVAFGVLLMNMAVPTIDYHTQPRVFGEQPPS